LQHSGSGAAFQPDDHAVIARFLDMMSAERGAARNSLIAYQSDLRQASA
jgi:integrase/recombinase XerD